MSWAAPVAGTIYDGSEATISSYTVYWKEGTTVSSGDSDGSQEVDAAADGSGSIRIVDLSYTTTYALIITVTNSAGLSATSSVVTQETAEQTQAEAPAALTSMSATANTATRSIELSWAEATNFGQDVDANPAEFTAYNIYWVEGTEAINVAADPNAVVTEVSTTSYTIAAAALNGDTDYSIGIVVVNDDDLQSDIATASTRTADLSTAPGAVSNIQRNTAHQTIGELSISWTAGVAGKDTSGTDAPTSYSVYIAEHDVQSDSNSVIADALQTASSDVAEYTFSGLGKVTSYDIVIVPINSSLVEEHPHKKGTAVLEQELVSNGISSISIQSNGIDAGESLAKTMADVQFTLSASLGIVVGVSEELTWSSTPADTVEITEDPENSLDSHHVTISILKAGLTTITVTSVADPTIQDSLSLTVNKQSLADYTLSYGASTFALSTLGNTIQSIAVDNTKSTIPADATIIYSVSVTPETEISINSNTGSISVSVTPETAGTYTVNVRATASTVDPTYTGSTSTSLIVEVIEGIILKYKADMSGEAQGVFTESDLTNSFLFSVEDIDILRADVSIGIAGNPTSVYDGGDVTRVAGQDNEGETIIGIGVEPGAVDFATMPDTGIQIRVLVTLATTHQISRTVTVTKGSTTNLYGWRDLVYMSNNLGANYIMQNDISFPNRGAFGFDTFVPVGSEINPFTGNFDGQTHTISGLYIDEFTDNHVGLFSYIKPSTNTKTVHIKDLVIDHSGIKGSALVGALAGKIEEGVFVENVGMKSSTTAAVWASTFEVGGLVGYNDKGTVIGYSLGAVKSTNISIGYVGGLVGNNRQGTVTGYTTGEITSGVAPGAGGLVGNNTQGTVTGYVTGTIRGSTDIGGLVGQSWGGTVVGYVTGTVTGKNNVGGLVGDNEDGTAEGYVRGTVTRSSGTDVGFGLLTGRNNIGTVVGYHATTESSLLDADGSALTGTTGVDGTALSMASTTTQSDFPGLSFYSTAEADANNPWEWVADGKWPAIRMLREDGTTLLQAVEDQPID